MPVAIPCTTGTVALYRGDGEQLLAVPVEAWDDKGAALVAGVSGLISAAERPGFAGLELAAIAVPAQDRPVRTPVRSGPRPGRRGHREREGA